MQTEILQLKAFAEKSEDGRITVIASDETIDRSGEVVPIDGWDLVNFRRSPRLLIDHDYSVKSVVGLAGDIRVQGRQLLFDPLFHEITQAARETKQMVEQGFLDTVSVGFIRKEESGRIINELLEVSFVAVPCNPNARMLSVKDIDPDEEKAVEAFVSKIQEPVPENQPPPVEESVEEEKSAEPEAKAGRTISAQTRQHIETAINSLEQASGALKQLLEGAEAQGIEGKSPVDGGGDPNQRSNDAGSEKEVFHQWLLMKQVLRAVNTATSEALSKSKLFIRSK